MKNTNLIALIGIIVVAITIVLFLIGMPFGKLPIDYVALLFILMTEAIYFGILLYSEKLSSFTNLAITPIASVYAFISLILSVLFKGLFVYNITAFVTIHIILLAIFAVIFLISGKVTSSVENNEKIAVMQRAVIDECETKAEILLNSGRFPNHTKKLERIYEEIKYSDHISDAKSGEILLALENISLSTDDIDIDKDCEKVLMLIAERNAIVKQMKRGSY